MQQKAWMDDRTMTIWYEKVLKVHLNNFDWCLGLLLNDFVCHESNELKNRLQNDNCLLHMVHPNYTSLLQPYDVGINRPLKDRVKKSRAKRRREPGQKIPSPKQKEVLYWLKNIWESFPVEIVKTSLISSGYWDEDGIKVCVRNQEPLGEGATLCIIRSALQ